MTITSYGSWRPGASSYGGQAGGPAPTGVVIHGGVGIATSSSSIATSSSSIATSSSSITIVDPAPTLPPQRRHELRTQHRRLPAPELRNLRELLHGLRLSGATASIRSRAHRTP